MSAGGGAIRDPAPAAAPPAAGNPEIPPIDALVARLADARDRVRGVVHRTPVVTSRTLDERIGAAVHLKCENLQRMGAFKFRGAWNAISRLAPEARARGVVAYSSGNHAQAVALASRLLSVPATIVMPRGVSRPKLDATRGYGAQVVFHEDHGETRERTAERLALERGLTLVPPFDHLDVIAGQGTATHELLEDVPGMDLLLVPVGGGGLISGAAIAVQSLRPECRVIGVEPASGDDGVQSFRTGRLVSIDTPDTIADGARTLSLGRMTFPLIRQWVADLTTVTDAELIEAMRFAWERLKLIVEPTGVLGLAALLAGRVEVPRGSTAGVILSGGNVELEQALRWISTP